MLGSGLTGHCGQTVRKRERDIGGDRPRGRLLIPAPGQVDDGELVRVQSEHCVVAGGATSDGDALNSVKGVAGTDLDPEFPF